MKFYTPSKFSIRLALVITVFFAVIWSLLNFFMLHLPWWHLAINSGIIFIFSWVTGRIMLHRFLYNRIKVIYKTIGQKKERDKATDLKKRINDPDFPQQLEEEVYEWAKKKNTELEELKKQEQFRREFIGNISHELKTPIFTIQGYLLTLLDGGLNDTSVNMEYLKRAEKSVNRLITIISDLETITRLDLGEQKLNYTKFDIQSLVNEVFESYEMKAAEKKIRLVMAPSGYRQINVYADRDKIRQVLNNLVENSIRYGKQGGTTTVIFSDMHEQVVVEVKDDGIGIAENEINRIFERFYRTAGGRAAEQNGSGLGLSIVKHIVEAHQQTINVRSALGSGTTFAFTLAKG